MTFTDLLKHDFMIHQISNNHQNHISRGGSSRGPELVIRMEFLLALIGINYCFKTKNDPLSTGYPPSG